MRHWKKYLLLGLGIGLLACNDQEETILVYPEEDPDTTTETPRDLTGAIYYLALGDSYTIGESVQEEERYPMQLADSLRKNDVDVAEVKIVARTGWTTDELTTALARENLQEGDYNLVSLLIGVNNQYRGYSLVEYQSAFTDLLNQAVAYAGGHKDRVFVVSIPDWGVTPFGQIYGNPQRTAEEIDRFNDVNFSITEAKGIRYFDITPISREALDDRSLVASDGLHPSGQMYTRWVELMLPEILKMMGR
jgi:lysophospholipase L1-like esterase